MVSAKFCWLFFLVAVLCQSLQSLNTTCQTLGAQQEGPAAGSQAQQKWRLAECQGVDKRTSACANSGAGCSRHSRQRRALKPQHRPDKQPPSRSAQGTGPGSSTGGGAASAQQRPRQGSRRSTTKHSVSVTCSLAYWPASVLSTCKEGPPEATNTSQPTFNGQVGLTTWLTTSLRRARTTTQHRVRSSRHYYRATWQPSQEHMRRRMHKPTYSRESRKRSPSLNRPSNGRGRHCSSLRARRHRIQLTKQHPRSHRCTRAGRRHARKGRRGVQRPHTRQQQTHQPQQTCNTYGWRHRRLSTQRPTSGTGCGCAKDGRPRESPSTSLTSPTHSPERRRTSWWPRLYASSRGLGTADLAPSQHGYESYAQPPSRQLAKSCTRGQRPRQGCRGGRDQVARKGLRGQQQVTALGAGAQAQGGRGGSSSPSQSGRQPPHGQHPQPHRPSPHPHPPQMSTAVHLVRSTPLPLPYPLSPYAACIRAGFGSHRISTHRPDEASPSWSSSQGS